MKKNILVPTDFSNNAQAAARYALALAKRQGYDVHITHAYPVFRSVFQNRETSSVDAQRAESEAKMAMDRFIASLSTSVGELSITTSLLPGHLVDVVVEHTQTNPDVLVVMGTHGATGSRLGLLGTNTYDIAKAINTPLVVVPEHVDAFKLENMVFFSDFQPRDGQTLKGYASLFGGVGQHNTMVHIAEQDANVPNSRETKQMEEWKIRMKNESGLDNLETAIVSGKESVALVHEILDRYNADLTVLTLVGGRGFFEKLVTKSLARAIILHPKTPVLLIN